MKKQFNISNIICLAFLCVLTALFISACDKRKSVTRTASSLSGFGLIAMGMTLEEGWKAISGNGVLNNETGENSHSLTYNFSWDIYKFRVVQFFNEFKIASSSAAKAIDAELAESASECRDFFNTYQARFTKQYGKPDYEPRFKQEKGIIYATAMYSFSDSTNIRINYIYDNKCNIMIESHPAWSKLCNFTNNRYCNFPDLYPYGF